MSTERLLEIKKQIDEAKSKQSEIIGQIKSVTDQMDQKFEVKTLAKANEKLKEIGNELDSQETEFKKGMEELEGAYEWE
jgi:uncharacterized coiled-coil DUF342 family protein